MDAALDGLLDAALDGLSALVAVLDHEGRVRHANAAWCQHAAHPWAGIGARPGADFGEVLRRRRSAAFDDIDALLAVLGAAADDPPAPVAVITREYALGDPRAPTHWRTTMRVLPGGGVLVQHEDITGPRSTEAALKRSQARLRTILTGAPLVLFSLDARGVFTLVEGMGAGTGGFASPDQVGSSVFDAYTHMPALLDVVRGALAGIVGVTTVHVGRLAYEIRCSPLLGLDDAVDGAVGIATDVSERVRLQRLKDEFISIVSHELRTPLTSIRGSLGLLEGGVTGALPDRSLELVRIARVNTDRLIRLISDMLDLDKIEAGLLELQPTEFPLSDVLDGACHEMTGLAAHVGVRIVREPDACGPCPLLADRDRVVQVLVNLLSNAIKFSPAEGVVRVALRREGSHARVGVRDDGPGIAQADVGRLFQKFSQLDASDSRARGGSGLGLVICKRIVEASGGRIGVHSEPGVGSEFWIELPTPAPATVANVRPLGGDHGATVHFSPMGDVGGQNDGITRTDELLGHLREAARSGDASALADAHAAAMILAASTTESTGDHQRLRACGQAIDAALAAPPADREILAARILADIEPFAAQLRALGARRQ